MEGMALIEYLASEIIERVALEIAPGRSDIKR